ncbi:MAG TPA: MIP/aquaporin family protein [Amycolatopsis sp.]|jgi:glycerol uptake facilitator protein|nr:MIP/aquaporin family protein [Amycolatopsis sp.]
MSAHLGRRLVAELIGTALLVIFGAGALVAALKVGGGQINYAGIGIVALSFALVVAAVIYMFGKTSGAHINPAVTVALAVVRRFPWIEVVPYLVAQAAGAVAGALLVNVMFGKVAVTLNVSGGTVVAPGYTYWQGVLAEGLGTALLLFTIMALAIDRRAPTGWSGLVIGLAVGCEIMVIGPITNGSVNPARTFGPYIATNVFGGSTPWSEYWVYLLGPLAGAVLAALVYDLVAAPRKAEAEEEAAVAPLTAEPEGVQGTLGEVPGPREGGPRHAQREAENPRDRAGEVPGRGEQR